MADSNLLTESQKRRRRISLYKKLIVLILLLLILLPTIFCIVLFVKVGRLQKQLDTLMILRTTQANEQFYEAPTDVAYLIREEETTTVEHATEKAYVEADELIETIGLSDKEGDKVVSSNEIFYGNYSENMAATALQEGRKVVYLTFDDGPSNNTDAILDILDEYNVKGTFFTIGHDKDEFKDEYLRIVSGGHSLGMHSFSHRYDDIYKTVKGFEEDLNMISAYLEETVGFAPTLYRFPGGSSNLVSAIPMENFIRYLNSNNYTYFDWNASAKDAEGVLLSADTIVNNIMNDVNKKDIVVVLMHDADNLTTTVQALPKLIEKLIEMDAVMLPITENTTLIQHIVCE